jgi:uncharacterized membrane protein (UPF0127 family)
MVFDLPDASSRGFWMYRTYIPLDLLYMHATERGGEFSVIAFSTMEPCVREQNESDTTWQSRCVSEAALETPSVTGFTAVLELPAGWLARQGFDPSTAIGNLIVTNR